MSCAYEGWVTHRRSAPVEHAFRYRVCMVFRDAEGPGRDGMLDLVERRTGRRPQGPVRVLTQPRRFGVSYNPVSFYYCYEDGRVAAVVAEVTNTPWGERHAYVLDGPVRKALHVSPFLGMDGEYTWRVSEPGETLHVHLAFGALDATLSLRRRELSRLRRYPAGPLAVLARIYLQALRLKLKGVAHHPHPAR